MPTFTTEYASDAERIGRERAVASVQEMRHLGATASPGTVLEACETFALDAGRRLLRDTLAAAVQTRADAEKKSPAPGRTSGTPGPFGEASDATTPHTEAGRTGLLSEGKTGRERWLTTVWATVPAGTSPDPLVALAASLAKHPTRLNDADRWARGRSLGNGGGEGAIKRQVNLRLKRTGARWGVGPVGPLVELHALSQTPDGQTLWTAA